ncbi:ubiquinol-cytochrome C reductase hinge domain-containing protein [Gautieria morchelliformis]|nr:ubiquinol-cytochrome C reductase hinge domain-containing protein [Gautieria morchelliformis]
MLSTFLSSFAVHADAPAEEVKSQREDDVTKEAGDSTADAENEAGAGEAEEEEEEEPEDIHPTLREDCSNSPACAGFKKHFEHCQAKVEAGEGFKGEDCVEELMMHCADHCVAPKLFSKLR